MSVRSSATNSRSSSRNAPVSDAIVFKPAGDTIKISDIFLSKIGESAETRRQAMREANGWYAAFTHDMLG